MFKSMIVWIGLLIMVGSNIAFAQTFPTEQAVQVAVKKCLDVVHGTTPHNFILSSYYENFDAFYNPASKQVEFNGNANGDLEPRFEFKKCMAENKIPITDVTNK